MEARKRVSGRAKDARTVNAVPLAPALYATSKMLFGVLFASLYGRQPTLSLCVVDGGRRTNLCWLANFCADHLPLVRFVFLDGIEESLTLFEHQQLDAMRCLADVPRLLQILHNACPRNC
jgi:hypothetical protein